MELESKDISIKLRLSIKSTLSLILKVSIKSRVNQLYLEYDLNPRIDFIVSFSLDAINSLLILLIHDVMQPPLEPGIGDPGGRGVIF